MGVGSPKAMASRPVGFVSLVSALLVSVTTVARANDEACMNITRENVAACAVRASGTVRAEREAASAATDRKASAARWLPTNPTFAVTIARRSGTDGRSDALNYGATFSQEMEIAGQRGARLRAAEADVRARAHGVVARARQTAAEGYITWFEVLAAQESLAVARYYETTAQRIARVTRGRADAGVSSPLEADLAEGASLRVTQARLAAERDLHADAARLASLLGRDPRGEVSIVTGELEPLRGSDELAHSANARTARDRPEIRSLDDEARVLEERASMFRRARVPNVTLQLFAQNDGYNERVLGGGILLPLPLPEPLGRFYAGEIREAEARARQTGAERDALSRELTTDLAVAVTAYETRRKEAALFNRDRLDRSQRWLSELAKELEAGRLSIRDALLAEEQLVELLRASVEARLAVCLASVRLAVAASEPLERESR